ncbi:hypothetical protein P3T76_011585 [Phytophthora citrophthora]|uniref:RxLR effector protein n=1 Tax=Phytophthora citrophthora TaxID=4793 RepID=A0AAD9G8R5_9STRA|nr:hypothetical protein P3T76_011585 [Phytophthora citrophthora]
MRLLLWAVLLVFVAFVSSINAESAADSKVTQASKEEINAVTRLLAVDNSDVTKRFLRGDAKDLTAANDDSKALSAEDEERGLIPSSVTNLISKVKTGWANLKSAALERAFKHMVKNGENPTSLAKRLDIGRTIEARHHRLYEKFTAWWINYHTVAGT